MGEAAWRGSAVRLRNPTQAYCLEKGKPGTANAIPGTCGSKIESALFLTLTPQTTRVGQGQSTEGQGNRGATIGLRNG